MHRHMIKASLAILSLAGAFALSSCGDTGTTPVSSTGTLTASTTPGTGTGGTGTGGTGTATLAAGCAFSSTVTTDVLCVTMSAVSTSLAADGTSTTAVSANVTKNGSPVAGDVVEFSLSNSTYGTVTQAGLTSAAGVATVTFTAGTTVGAVRVIGTYDTAANYVGIGLTVSGAVPPTVTLGNGCAISSTIASDTLCLAVVSTTNSLVANGTATATISATLTKNGVPLPNEVVDFSLSNSLYGSLDKITSITSAGGVASVTLTASTVAGAVYVNAAFDTATNKVAVGLTASPPVPGAPALAASCQFSSTVATDVICISVVSSATSVAADGTSKVTISATATKNGSPIVGDIVNFELGAPTYGTLAATTGLTSATGVATTTFQAGNALGAQKITGSYDTASSYTAIGLTAAPSTATAGGIEFVSADPAAIGVQSSGQISKSTVTFKVTDSAGTPIPGATVNFTMVGPLGAYVGTTPGATTTSASTDSGGSVSVSLNSGNLAGTVTISASVTAPGGTFSASSSVISIGGAVPSASHFTVAAARHNLPGLVVAGFTTTLSVFIADRFSNSAVLEGTQVSLYTEAGAVAPNVNNGLGVDATGIGTATFRTQDPMPIDTAPFGAANNSDGWVTAMAVVRGEEGFVDANGNGVYDAGEPFSDLGEPYVDANNSGSWDLGEFYVDTDGNGAYTPANGLWDGPNCAAAPASQAGCNPSPNVWTTTQLMFTGNLSCTLDPFFVDPIPNGGSQTFNFSVSDVNGNWPVPGTTITITAGGGSLVGEASLVVPDISNSSGPYTGSVRLGDPDSTTVDAKAANVSIKVTPPTGEVAGCNAVSFGGTL